MIAAERCAGCVPPALHAASLLGSGVALPGPLLGDPEGEEVPTDLVVFDAHVHLFPERLNLALWSWFEQNAWRIRYRLHAEQAVAFLRARGVRRMTALLYAHRPGMAVALNRFAAELGRAHPEVMPLGTVFPGEPDAAAVVRDALGPLGLRGIKLHCHVQRLPADAPALDEIYAEAQSAGRPVVIHAGREPSSPGYGVDTRVLCGVTQVQQVLQRFPRLKLVVPHLGADEFEPYAALLDTHENLWLDTTMAVSGYFAGVFGVDEAAGLRVAQRHPRRLLYGSDFPNLPYAWDRELGVLCQLVPDPADRAALFYQNAADLFGD